MSNTIYKYRLDRKPNEYGEIPVLLPAGARTISVGLQGDGIVIWAIVDDEAPDDACRTWFLVLGTGKRNNSPGFGEFIGTVNQGPSWWHVFKLPFQTIAERSQHHRAQVGDK